MIRLSQGKTFLYFLFWNAVAAAFKQFLFLPQTTSPRHACPMVPGTTTQTTPPAWTIPWTWRGAGWRSGRSSSSSSGTQCPSSLSWLLSSSSSTSGDISSPHHHNHPYTPVFREMRCLRHKIHLNLFLSLLTANLDWVLSYATQVKKEWR